MSIIEHFSSSGTLHYVVVKTRELTLQEIFFRALLNSATSNEKAAYPDPLVVVRF
jgi:hypothetical protein